MKDNEKNYNNICCSCKFKYDIDETVYLKTKLSHKIIDFFVALK